MMTQCALRTYRQLRKMKDLWLHVCGTRSRAHQLVAARVHRPCKRGCRASNSRISASSPGLSGNRLIMTGGLACWIRRVCADQDGTGVGALSKGLSSKAVDADKSQKSAETHESAAEVRT